MMVHLDKTGTAGRVAVRMASWLVAGAAIAVSGEALAQGAQPTLPGLVVTTPPEPRAPRAPVAPLRTEQAPAPKPKAKPRREASTSRASSEGSSGRSSRQLGIVVLVNDQPITGYEIDQRAALMAAGAGIGERAQAAFKRIAQDPDTNNRLRAILDETVQANRGKSREQILAIFEQRKKAFVEGLQRRAIESARASVLPGMREKAIDELIDERLKVQEGKRLGVTVTEEEVNKTFLSMAERNKVTEAQFAAQLKSQGIGVETIKARTRAALVWRDVIRRKFGAQITVSDREVDRFIAESADDGGAAKVEMQLHRITLAVPGRIDQAALARRLSEAEQLRRRFRDCRSTQELVKGVENAKFDSLVGQAASAVTEPTRSMLLNAKEGEMVPPTLASAGVELYAVCGRKTVKVDDEQRLKAQQELTMREFDVLSRRHLRDLRTDALIERR